MKRLAAAAILPLMLLTAACQGQGQGPGSPSDSQPAPQTKVAVKPVNLIPDGYSGRFKIQASVLESPQHGPQLCRVMAESYPPQCGGLPVLGFDWTQIKHESANGVKWTAWITLTGTYDGKALTLTEKPQGDESSYAQPALTPDFTSPCTAPPGGWRPLDAAKATDDAFNEAVKVANASPDFAGVWIDDHPPADMATPSNDPKRMILNVKYTKDLLTHQAELRKVWGGSLCVSQAAHTEAELRKIQDELTRPDVTSTSSEIVSGTVQVETFAAYASRQRELDAKYGPGLVVLAGSLTPID